MNVYSNMTAYSSDNGGQADGTPSKNRTPNDGDTPVRMMDSVFDPRIPQLLPHENMYKIQVGNRLFRISGASLSSDGPNYFTKCFSKQCKGSQDSSLDHVLFIDRSADVFQLIYDHLQGYFIHIEDEVQYTMLHADAMYYSLPRLRAFLKETEYYYTNVGGQSFKIPRSLFRRKGDSSNYFMMTSAALYVDVEKIFIEKKLLRPPPQAPPYVARCPEFFRDLMHLLGGASLDLDDCRRESLIKECRYYRLLNLEQRLIKHRILYNPYTHHEEICLHLKDVNKRGVELPLEKDLPLCAISGESTPFEEERSSVNQSEGDKQTQQPPLKKPKSGCANENQRCWSICNYIRPYVDEYARELCFQIDKTDCVLVFNKRSKTIHVCLANDTARHFESLFADELAKIGFNLAACKLKMPPLDLVVDGKPAFNLILPACVSVCDLSINGVKCSSVRSALTDNQTNEQVPDLTNFSAVLSSCPGVKLHLTKSIWKLGIRPGKVMMIALKAEGFKGIKEYCKMLDYL
ncbi:YDR132C and YLR108C [Zygosaccharomyces parabailii]|nr:YDR132C and YLR108C [Zygosaccharomyces parabailii]